MIGGMADEQRGDDGPSLDGQSLDGQSLDGPSLRDPSLEAPSLGRLLGRRRQRATSGRDGQTPSAAPGEQGPADGSPTAVVPEVAPERVVDEPGQPEPAPQPPRSRMPRPSLAISGRVAAAIAGLVIGLLVVVLTAGSLALCESARNVSTCGGGPGFALLLAITGSMVALGGLMLRLARVPDPTSTSFLAVGLLCVLALLFLVDSFEEWWMILVVPLMSVATFLLSHWVTTSIVEPADA